MADMSVVSYFLDTIEFKIRFGTALSRNKMLYLPICILYILYNDSFTIRIYREKNNPITKVLGTVNDVNKTHAIMIFK